MGRPKGSKNKSNVEAPAEGANLATPQQEMNLNTPQNVTAPETFTTPAAQQIAAAAPNPIQAVQPAKTEKPSPAAPVTNNVSSAVETKVLGMVMDLSITLHKQSEKTSEMLSQFLSLQSQINTTFQQMFRRIEEVEKAVAQPFKFGTEIAQPDLRRPIGYDDGVPNAGKAATVHPFPAPVRTAPVTEVQPPQATTAAPVATPAPQTTSAELAVVSGLSVPTETPKAVTSGVLEDDMGLL